MGFSWLRKIFSNQPSKATQDLAEFQYNLQKCTASMLLYEYTLFEEMVSFGQRITPSRGSVDRAYDENREWLRVRIDLIKREFQRRGISPKSFPHLLRQHGAHAWQITEDEVKRAWKME